MATKPIIHPPGWPGLFYKGYLITPWAAYISYRYAPSDNDSVLHALSKTGINKIPMAY